MFILRNGTIRRGTFGSGGSSEPADPASFTNGYTYMTGRDMYIYTPAGYNLGSNYPVMMFLVGDGVRDGWGNALSQSEGYPYFLNTGVWAPEMIVCVPQIITADVNYGAANFDAVLNYLATGSYKYNPNRVYLTGLSRGAMGIDFIIQTKSASIAGVVPIAGPAIQTGWTNPGGGYNHKGFWYHEGTNDGNFGRTLGGTLYWANGNFGAWNDLTPAPRVTYHYPQGHGTAVWNTQVYASSSIASGSDFERYLAKFSTDPEERATLFTSNAEFTQDIVDWRESRTLVDNISSSATRTDLLTRLDTLKATINKTNGVRHYISMQTEFIGAIGQGYNIWVQPFSSSRATGSLVDMNGSSSTLTITASQQFIPAGASSWAANASDTNAGRMRAHGFEYLFNQAGMVLSSSVSGGYLTLGNISTGKLVDVLVYHHHVAPDDDSVAISAVSGIKATVNGVTKGQYSAYNNAYYVKFENIPEVNNKVTMSFATSGSRNIIVQGVEVLIHD